MVAETNLNDAVAAKGAIDAQVDADPTNADLLQQQADALAALEAAQIAYDQAMNTATTADQAAKAASATLDAARMAAHAAGIMYLTPPV